jgi:lysophospholipase L1-like esterase
MQKLIARAMARQSVLISHLAILIASCSLVAAAQVASPSPLPFPINPKLPTIFVIGDSTANNNANGARGWADPFIEYFDATKVNVLNRARAGRSSRTFITEGLWDKVLAEMKAGDFVVIQFGHNDGGPLNTDRARGSLPGIGDETREVVMPAGKSEVVHTYGYYLRKFVDDTRARRATPIVLSLTVRNIWIAGKVERGAGKFREWAKAVALSQDVDFIDLTMIVADAYEKMGEEQVKGLFATDHTHTSPQGAAINAAKVIAGLKALRGNPLQHYFSPKADTVKNLRAY